jgi:hypothetical protein
MSVISTRVSPAWIKATALGSVSVSTLRIWAFEVFPQRTHRIWGGGPNRSSRTTKSASLVMTTASAVRAALKISGSSVLTRPRCRRLAASIANSLVIHGANAGESCASTQMIKRRVPGDQDSGTQSGGMPGDPLPQDRAFPRGFQRWRGRQRTNPGHR